MRRSSYNKGSADDVQHWLQQNILPISGKSDSEETPVHNRI
jgi:hypothetical protein